MTDLYNPVENEPGDDQNQNPGNSGEMPDSSNSSAPKPAEDLFGDAANSGDLTDFLDKTAATPKQQYQHKSDTNADPDKVEQPSSGEPTSVADGKKLEVSKKSKAGAQMVTKTIDFAFSRGAALITHQEAEKWKASKSDEEELLEAWALYIESNNMEIPVWLQLIILNLVIYGFRVPDVIKARKEYLAAEKKRKQAADQRLAREKAIADNNRGMDNGTTGPGTGEGGSDSPPNPGSRTTEKTTIVYTHCRKCKKELTEEQVLRGAQFCGTAHANQFRAEEKKRKRLEEIQNQS